MVTLHFGLEGGRAAFLIEFCFLFFVVGIFLVPPHVKVKGPRASLFTIESLRHSKSGSVFLLSALYGSPSVFLLIPSFPPFDSSWVVLAHLQDAQKRGQGADATGRSPCDPKS